MMLTKSVLVPTRLTASAAQASSTTQPSETPRLVAFFVLSYAVSWAWLIPLVVAGQTVVPGRAWPTHFPSVLGPLVAAFLVTRRSGLRDLVARMTRWRIGWRWWLVALSPLAFLGAALCVVAASGKPPPRFDDFACFSGLPSTFGVVGVAVLIIGVGGLGEETGWRGFALPRLQRRFSPLTATLILAACWAGWHIPQFFVLETYRGFSLGTGIGFVLGLACGAVVATWLYNRTDGSILALAVWHGTYNIASGTRAAIMGSATIASIVSALIMVQAVVLVGLELLAAHRGNPSILLGGREARPRSNEQVA